MTLDVLSLSDAELRSALVEYNVYASPPPVGATTRALLERKLQRAVDEVDQGSAKSSTKSASPKKSPPRNKSPPKLMKAVAKKTRASPVAQPREMTPFDDDDYAGEESFEAGNGSTLYPTLSESPYMRALYNRHEDIGVMKTPKGGNAYVSPKKARKQWKGNFTGWPRTIIFGMFFVFIALSVYMFAGRFMDEFAPEWRAFVSQFAAPFESADQIE